MNGAQLLRSSELRTLRDHLGSPLTYHNRPEREEKPLSQAEQCPFRQGCFLLFPPVETDVIHTPFPLVIHEKMDILTVERSLEKVACILFIYTTAISCPPVAHSGT